MTCRLVVEAATFAGSDVPGFLSVGKVEAVEVVFDGLGRRGGCGRTKLAVAISSESG